MVKWRCKVCGWIYDEDKENTPFEQLPDNWRCPRCNAPKNKFVKL